MSTMNFITGARGGIGRSLARPLSALGCRVAAVFARSVLARSVAATCAAHGLRIDAVAPGMTGTASTLERPAMREGAGRQCPLGGVQTAARVADVMAGRLGESAVRVTGPVVAVDVDFTTVRPLVK